jgi:hypothetical protein
LPVKARREVQRHLGKRAGDGGSRRDRLLVGVECHAPDVRDATVRRQLHDLAAQRKRVPGGGNAGRVLLAVE